MRLSSIKYYFKEGFTGLLRNRLMTVASIATVAACIFIMTFSYCIIGNLQYMLEQMEDSIGIAVFLDEDLTSDDVGVLMEQIKKVEYVKNVTYISPEEALNSLKVEWDVGDVLDGFDAENNPLSHSFEIELDGIDYQGSVLASLESMDGIRNIRHAQTETDVLLKINKVLGIVGVVVIAILGIISVVIIMNTIKISVYTRRNEINIMKFVGATDWFIRWPFIIEGVLIGIIGSAIPMAIAWPSYGKAIDLIYKFLPVIENLVTFKNSIDIFSVLLPVSIVSGILLGVIGSVTSIRKHLKV